MSLWQTPAASTVTTMSFGPDGSGVTSSISSGCPTACMMAACMRGAFLGDVGGLERRLDEDGLRLGEELAAEVAALPADAGVARAPDGSPEVAHLVAVGPDGPRLQVRGGGVDARRRLREERGGEAVVGVVGEREAVLEGVEGGDRRHRPEDLL